MGVRPRASLRLDVQAHKLELGRVRSGMTRKSHGDGVIPPDELVEDDNATRPVSGPSWSERSLPSASSSDRARRAGRNDPLVGEVLDGRFRVLRLVARGGMGRIYEAEQMPLGRRVALKVMDLSYAEELDPDFQKRFFLEASTCARLSHPNTIRVFDYGSADPDTYYIVMEFIEGQTLLKTINDEAPLHPLRVVQIARQICGSLAEAHGQGVIHRDLKPSNVLLRSHGETKDFVKVLDFGLVKLIREGEAEITKSGLFLGSPNYMSPEQIRSNRIDQRADIYSLGVLLYMCVTAQSPFKRNTSVNVLLAQLEDDPPPFSRFLPDGALPQSLEWIVLTCLEKDPAARFASVEELNRALKACEAELTGQIGFPLRLKLERGRVVLPEGFEVGLTSMRWTSGATPPVSPGGAGIEPVSSQGSIVGKRRVPVEPSARQRSRVRKQRKGKDRVLASPWFTAFLGASALGLLVLLILLIRAVSGGSEPTDVVQQAPPEAPVDAPAAALEDAAPEQPPVGDLPPEEPIARPAVERPRARPQPSTTRPKPRRSEAPASSTAAASDPKTDPASTATPKLGDDAPAASPAPAPEEAEPARAKRGTDLRDPWAD